MPQKCNSRKVLAFQTAEFKPLKYIINCSYSNA